MGKFNYPKFKIKGTYFVAVMNERFSLVISPAGNYSRIHGFEFNVYTSRAKVLQLEKEVAYSETTANEFFERANKFMSEELKRVIMETIKADPLLLANNPKLLD